MVNLELLNFTKRMDTLWHKFRSGEYGDGCGQYKDSRRRRKSNLNNLLLKCTFGCVVFFCFSVLMTMIANFQWSCTTFVIGLYFVGVFALLTALCLGAIILSLSRVWCEIKYERLKDFKKSSFSIRGQYIYNSKYGGRTMEEFSRLLAQKLTELQKIRKDS